MVKNVTVIGILSLVVSVWVYAQTQYPVYISKDLSLKENLASPNEAKTLQQQYDAKWDYAYDTINLKGEVAKVDTCTGFVAAQSKEMYAKKEYENAYYLATGNVCETISEVLNAKPAVKSYVADLKFDEQFPAIAPALLSMQISKDDKRKIAVSNSWQEATNMTKHKKIDAYTSTYWDQTDGEQTIKLIARGDVNTDEYEDLIVTVESRITSGSYSSVRTFILTRKSADTPLSLIKEL